jgi:hypothetical protein
MIYLIVGVLLIISIVWFLIGYKIGYYRAVKKLVYDRD